jgi:hypothetical protein
LKRGKRGANAIAKMGASSMINTNCLEGMHCPKCDNDNRFDISAVILMRVTDDGTEDLGVGHEWDDESFCACPECQHTGTVKDFILEATT